MNPISTEGLFTFILNVGPIRHDYVVIPSEEEAAAELIESITKDARKPLPITVTDASLASHMWCFTLVCSLETAKEIDDLDFDISPAAGNPCRWHQPDLLNWNEFYSKFCGMIAHGHINTNDKSSMAKAVCDDKIFNVIGFGKDSTGKPYMELEEG